MFFYQRKIKKLFNQNQIKILDLTKMKEIILAILIVKCNY